MNIKQILWIFPFLSFIAGYFIINGLFPTQVLLTPPLIGKQLYDACTILSEKRLNIRILAEQEEPSLSPGIIMNQMPAAGQKIKPQQSVFLVISRQPPTAQTPQLMGNVRAEIEKIAAKNHLTIQYQYVPNALPKDYCIAQQPSPDTPLTQKITCYLADGKPFPVIFPNFINRPVDEVVAYLTAQGITPEINSYSMSSDQSPQGIIIDQRPLPGSIITLDATHPVQVHLQVR